MYIVILGAGEVGYTLAKILCYENQDVALVEVADDVIGAMQGGEDRAQRRSARDSQVGVSAHQFTLTRNRIARSDPPGSVTSWFTWPDSAPTVMRSGPLPAPPS